MQKVLKKIVAWIGIILLGIVIIVNLRYNVELNVCESAIIQKNMIWLSLIYIMFAYDIYMIAKLLYHKYRAKDFNDKKSKILKRVICIFLIFIYIIGQIMWINQRDAIPSVDQKTAYQLAVAMKNNNVNEFLDTQTTYGSKISDRIYMQCYSHQFTLSFVWSILFRICGTEDYILIEYMNAICNAITIIAIYLICTQLSKKYKVNKFQGLFIMGTFIALPLLSIFIYGDLSSIAFGYLSVYFLMKYRENRKKYNAGISGVCIALAYMLRMNSLIFIIAECIYLLLDLFEKTTVKETISKIVVLIVFAIIAIMPATMVKNYCVKKYNLDSSKVFPMSGYLYMGMTKGLAGQGWYKYETASKSFVDTNEANIQYRQDIKNRINEFKNNPLMMFEFYRDKITSIWAEPTCGGIYYNYSFNFLGYLDIDELDYTIYDLSPYIARYEKVLLILIFGCSILVVYQKRKDMSLDLALLLIIFIGGFLFHLLWEAKSRYILPYIIALVPIASIEIEAIFKKKKKMITNGDVKE